MIIQIAFDQKELTNLMVGQSFPLTCLLGYFHLMYIQINKMETRFCSRSELAVSLGNLFCHYFSLH